MKFILSKIQISKHILFIDNNNSDSNPSRSNIIDMVSHGLYLYFGDKTTA